MTSLFASAMREGECAAEQTAVCLAASKARLADLLETYASRSLTVSVASDVT